MGHFAPRIHRSNTLETIIVTQVWPKSGTFRKCFKLYVIAGVFQVVILSQQSHRTKQLFSSLLGFISRPFLSLLLLFLDVFGLIVCTFPHGILFLVSCSVISILQSIGTTVTLLNSCLLQDNAVHTNATAEPVNFPAQHTYRWTTWSPQNLLFVYIIFQHIPHHNSSRFCVAPWTRFVSSNLPVSWTQLGLLRSKCHHQRETVYNTMNWE